MNTKNLSWYKSDICLSSYIKKIALLIALTIFIISCKPQKTLLFIGSYTEGKPSEGIYVYDFNTKTQELTLLHTVDSIVNPSFLTLAPNGRYLYSVTKSQLKTLGTVSSFAVDSLSGKLQFLNEQDAGGRNPVHLAISNDGQHLINSNYTDPSLSVLKINLDGSLNKLSQFLKFKDSSIVRGRQDEAHIHSSNFSPNNNFVFAQDLGADKIRAFKWRAFSDSLLQVQEVLTIKMKPGSGPRHFTFHPSGKYAYGIAELSGKISQYNYLNGQLSFQKDYLSYVKEQEIYRAADIHISPDGKFLYVSNRAPEENSISIFSIDLDNGNLKLVGHEPTQGEHPRNFVIDPSGNFLIVANQFSNSVIVFKRDQKTGELEKTLTELKIKNPSSLRMRVYK